MNKFSDCDSETMEFLDKVFLKDYKKKIKNKILNDPSKLLDDDYFRSLEIMDTKKNLLNRNI